MVYSYSYTLSHTHTTYTHPSHTHTIPPCANASSTTTVESCAHHIIEHTANVKRFKVCIRFCMSCTLLCMYVCMYVYTLHNLQPVYMFFTVASTSPMRQLPGKEHCSSSTHTHTYRLSFVQNAVFKLARMHNPNARCVSH